MNTERIVKIYLSADNTRKVRTLRIRTSLTPNVLCRFALALSLRDRGSPDPTVFPNDGMEFNRYTLLGTHEVLMLALVRQRCLQDGLDPEAELEEQLRAHINRGIGILYPRLKSLSDLGELTTQAYSARSR